VRCGTGTYSHHILTDGDILNVKRISQKTLNVEVDARYIGRIRRPKEIAAWIFAYGCAGTQYCHRSH
jgi:hypothetical protein